MFNKGATTKIDGELVIDTGSSVSLVCCIYDKLAKNFQTPMIFPTADVFKRTIFNGVSQMNDNAEMKKFAIHYDLYTIGTFNMVTGQLTPLDPSKVSNLKELLDTYATLSE